VFSVGALFRAFQRRQDDAELRDDPVVVRFTERRGATLWLTIDHYAQVNGTGQVTPGTGSKTLNAIALFRAPI
jgi:hypothetical protein